MFDETKGGGWNRVTEVLELTSEGSEAKARKDREEVVLAISILIYYRKSQQTTPEVNTSRNSIIMLLLAQYYHRKKKKKRIVRQDLDEQGAIAFVTNSAVVIWYLPMCMHYFD